MASLQMVEGQIWNPCHTIWTDYGHNKLQHICDSQSPNSSKQGEWWVQIVHHTSFLWPTSSLYKRDRTIVEKIAAIMASSEISGAFL